MNDDDLEDAIYRIRRIPRPLRVGDCVTVVALGAAFKTTVWYLVDHAWFWCESCHVRKHEDEGLTWARGWDTPAADALRTADALRPG